MGAEKKNSGCDCWQARVPGGDGVGVLSSNGFAWHATELDEQNFGQMPGINCSSLYLFTCSAQVTVVELGHSASCWLDGGSVCVCPHLSELCGDGGHANVGEQKRYRDRNAI